MAVISDDDVLSLDTVSLASSMADSADEHMNDPVVPDVDTLIHCEQYPSDDKRIQLQAENTVFRVHAYLFLHASTAGVALVEQARAEHSRPFRVEDATSQDLQRFFHLLYCPYASPIPFHTKEEWISILHLSYRWSFSDMRALAINQLSTLTSPADRIILGHTYGVDSWLLPAYQQICEREDWLSDGESRRLGIDDVLKVIRARVAIRETSSMRDSSTRTSVINAMFNGVDCSLNCRSTTNAAAYKGARCKCESIFCNFCHAVDVLRTFLAFAANNIHTRLHSTSMAMISVWHKHCLQVGPLMTQACERVKTQVSLVGTNSALEYRASAMAFALFTAVCLDVMHLWLAQTSPTPRLVIPAHVLPCATNDVVLPLSLSAEMTQAFQVAIAAATGALGEAERARFVFNTMIKAVEQEIAILNTTANEPIGWGRPHSSKFAREYLRFSQQRLSVYAELPKEAEEQATQAKVKVGDLLSQVCEACAVC